MHVKEADDNAMQALQLGPNATLHKTVSLHRLRQGICEGEAPEPPVIIFTELYNIFAFITKTMDYNRACHL